MKKIGLAVALLGTTLGYLLLAPTPIEPVAWTPPVAPDLVGVYAHNDLLKGIQRFGRGVGNGPEGLAIDADGQIYTGFDDGRLVMFSHDVSSYQELAKSEGGRPLGLAIRPDTGLLIADAHKGMLLFDKSNIKTLATEAEGQKIAFADDVDYGRTDDHVYFTDVAIYDYANMMNEVLEHKGTGRLIQYSLSSGAQKVLVNGLHFANGVAVGPNDEYILVNETSAYRVTRYWLKGPKAGTTDVFIDNLPGLPDNISYSGNGRFWLALYAPRDATLDKLLPGPAWLKKMVARLPHALQPRPPKKAFVLGLDLDGKVIANLQYDGDDAYAPITSVKEHGPWLYFGSLSADGLGRMPLNMVIKDAPPPPADWQQVPVKHRQFVPPTIEPSLPDNRPKAQPQS